VFVNKFRPLLVGRSGGASRPYSNPAIHQYTNTPALSLELVNS
jgi:hypothetical protein